MVTELCSHLPLLSQSPAADKVPKVSAMLSAPRNRFEVPFRERST